MLYLLIGLVTASIYGITIFAIDGYEALVDSIWMDFIFWWAIGAGALLSAIELRFGLHCSIHPLRPRTPACGQVPDHPVVSLRRHGGEVTAEVFADAWMQELKDVWNDHPEVRDKLAEIHFSSVIACGFKGEGQPRGVFVVEDGECVRAGNWNGEEANWDMRVDQGEWMKWVAKPLGMTGMGMAFTTGKLKFLKGDFKAMLKEPRLAGPFVKSFTLMTRIGTA